MTRRVLSDLFAIRQPRDFLHEVLQFGGLDGRSHEGAVVSQTFRVACRLYRGELEGYQKCDTHYHDFAHAAETFLAMARLLHGARLASETITARDLALGLTAAIFHDSGYIRASSDSKSRGASYRDAHEWRSMDFLSMQAGAIGLTNQEIDQCRTMIQGTMMAEDINAMSFRTNTHELLTRMLSVSDLLAQLSSATYLERLDFLCEEDRDSQAPRYSDLLDCCRKAIEFDKHARLRLANSLEGWDRYLVNHFQACWQTPINLYKVSMDRQIQYLSANVGQNGFDPHCHLRRWGSVKALQQVMSEGRHC